jgi:alpha-tubulin suppressor-like RCC1 family protein
MKKRTMLFISVVTIILLVTGAVVYSGINGNYGMENALDLTFIAISAGGNHSMAISSDGTLWGWGDNQHGQIGDGTRVRRYNPIRIMDDVIAISAGRVHTMAITTDGSLWAWGSNRDGMIGDGSESANAWDNAMSEWIITDNDRLYPVKIMDDVIAVSAGSRHTAAIRTDGSLWTWGNNFGMALGDGTTINRHSPVKIMDDAVTVSAGTFFTWVIKSDGSAWIFGYSGGHAIPQNSPLRANRGHRNADEVDNAIAVSNGRDNTFIILNDNSLWSWNIHRHDVRPFDDGQITWLDDCLCFYDDPPEGYMHEFPPRFIKIMENTIVVSAGNFHTMVVTDDGDLWAWGRNEEGQLGNGTFTAWDNEEGEIPPSNWVPQAISEPIQIMDNVISVSAGSRHTLAIREDGSLWSWGNNEYGQLGNGITEQSLIPTEIQVYESIVGA